MAEKITHKLRVAKQILFILFLFLNAFSVSAQGVVDDIVEDVPKSLGKSTQQDPEYVKPMREFLALRIYNVIKTTDFKIRNNDLNQTFHFNPNNGLGMGVGFSYRMLALDIGFVVPGTMRYQGDDPYTKFDLLSTLYGKKHVLDLNLQYYQGYFLDNASEFFPENTDLGPEGIRSDIESVDIALSYQNVFNHDKFSFQAAFLGDVIQKKSAGSPTFHGFVSLFGITADSALVRYDFENDLNQQAYINQLGLLSTGTGIGYAHTFVLPKNFFITLSGAPMGMLSATTAEVNHPNYENETTFKFNIRLFTRSAAGYNSDKFYVIFNFIHDYYFIRFGEFSRVDYAPMKLKLFFGYRIGKPAKG